MNNQEIVSKLWNLCNVLRDDGITYHQYVTELTYILMKPQPGERCNDKRQAYLIQANGNEKASQSLGIWACEALQDYGAAA